MGMEHEKYLEDCKPAWRAQAANVRKWLGRSDERWELTSNFARASTFESAKAMMSAWNEFVVEERASRMAKKATVPKFLDMPPIPSNGLDQTDLPTCLHAYIGVADARFVCQTIGYQQVMNWGLTDDMRLAHVFLNKREAHQIAFAMASRSESNKGAASVLELSAKIDSCKPVMGKVDDPLAGLLSANAEAVRIAAELAQPSSLEPEKKPERRRI